MTGLETETVAGYLVTFFDKIRFDRFDVSGGGEVENLFGFQVSQGKNLCSIAEKGRFEFVSDEALASPTEAVVFIGEGGRQTLLRIHVEKAMALLEWIGAASHTAGWECEAEGPTVPIGFHFIGPFEENLLVLE